MVTWYKSIKSQNFKFSVLWILGFDDLQVTKIQKPKNSMNRKLIWACPERSEHAQINFLFIEFMGFGIFASCKSSNPKTPNSKSSDFQIWRFWFLDFFCFKTERLKSIISDLKMYGFWIWPLYTLVISRIIRDNPQWSEKWTFVTGVPENVRQFLKAGNTSST